MEQGYYRELLKKKGMKVTGQRVCILETVAEHKGEHLTAEEIYDCAKESYSEIGLATVYRTIQLLVELQIINRVTFQDGIARYEIGDADRRRHQHHHAICRKCGRVIPVEDDLLEQLEQALEERIGFTVTDHEVNLYGFCSVCGERADFQDK